MICVGLKIKSPKARSNVFHNNMNSLMRQIISPRNILKLPLGVDIVINPWEYPDESNKLVP